MNLAVEYKLFIRITIPLLIFAVSSQGENFIGQLKFPFVKVNPSGARNKSRYRYQKVVSVVNNHRLKGKEKVPQNKGDLRNEAHFIILRFRTARGPLRRIKNSELSWPLESSVPGYPPKRNFVF